MRDTADEPVVFRTGPHWISQDITAGLMGLVLIALAYAVVFDASFVRFVWIPALPLIIRLSVDLPRYWRFETVLTTRRLVVNVGIVRDVYHTLLLRHVTGVDVHQNRLGRILGFGTVRIQLQGTSDDGVEHAGMYVLDYVRRPTELAEELRARIMVRVDDSDNDSVRGTTRDGAREGSGAR